MNILSQISVLVVILVMGIGSVRANAQGSEAQLHQVILESGKEEAKAKELEQESLETKEREDRRLRQVQKEIQDQRYKIEGYKMRQEKAEQELESLKIDQGDLNAKLQAIQGEREHFESVSNSTLQELDTAKREYNERQKSLEVQIADLSTARKRAERSITSKSIEVQELKAAAARLEATKVEIESKTAEMEADEMRIRSEWMQTKLAAGEAAKVRDEANARMVEAKNRRDEAVKELNLAKIDLAKAQKNRNETSAKVDAEVARYEKEIQSAHKSRIASESEQIRLEAEAAKIREYSYRMKESHDQALEQADQSDSLVWKSTLNLETARSELSRNVSAADRDGFAQSKESARIRGMQEAAGAASMMEAAKASIGGRDVANLDSASAVVPRPWITKSKCDAFVKPSKSAKKVGVFSEGQKFSASDYSNGWMKIQNDSGASVYVEGKCGKYEQ